LFFPKCFTGLEALGFARLIWSDHNNSVSILPEINENTIMTPRQEGLLEKTEESIRVSCMWIALDIELLLKNKLMNVFCIGVRQTDERL